MKQISLPSKISIFTSLLNMFRRRAQKQTTVEKPTPLTCPFCPDKFESRAELKQHVDKTPCLELPARCILCPAIFENANLLLTHAIHQHHKQPSGLFQCPACTLTNSTEPEFIQHLKECTGIIPGDVNKCSICSLLLPSSLELFHHVLDVHYNFMAIFKCPFCVVKVDGANDLSKHVWCSHSIAAGVRTEGNGFKCPFCESVLESREMLEEHVIQSHSVSCH